MTESILVCYWVYWCCVVFFSSILLMHGDHQTDRNRYQRTPSENKNYYHYSFIWQVIRLWNVLPLNIKKIFFPSFIIYLLFIFNCFCYIKILCNKFLWIYLHTLTLIINSLRQRYVSSQQSFPLYRHHSIAYKYIFVRYI